MTYLNALNLVKSGSKVKRIFWSDNEYLVSVDNYILIHYAFGSPNRYEPSDEDINEDDWLEV